MKNLQDALVRTIPGNLLLKIDVNAILENTAHDVDGIDVYNEKVEKYLKQCEKIAECKRRWREEHREEILEYNRKYNALRVFVYDAERQRKYRIEHLEQEREKECRYRERAKERDPEGYRKRMTEKKRRHRAKKKAERLAALAQTLKNESTESTTI